VIAGRQAPEGYRLDLDRPVGEALRSVATQQLLDGAHRLRESRSHEDVDAAVHNARKALKKTRSLLRLARPDLPADTYREENGSLRDVGRGLSDARDSVVLVATFDELVAQLVGLVPEPAVVELRRWLATGAGAPVRSRRALAEEAARALEAAAGRAQAWPLEGCDAATLRAGAQHAYARGRRAWRTAERKPTVEHLHAWRKRMKDLWYHQRLLATAWPQALEPQAKQSHRLSDLLGDDHDLALLRAALGGDGGPMSRTAADLEPVLELIAERRAELRAQAQDLAARVYAEKPKAYGRRLGAYVHAAHDVSTSSLGT
jgi:CHAD domain-containing protein